MCVSSRTVPTIFLRCCCCQGRSCRRSYYVVPERSIRKNFLIRAGNESDACEKVPGTIGGMPSRTCGAVAEWSKALAWKVSIRQKRIEGSNPSRSAKHPFPRVPSSPLDLTTRSEEHTSELQSLMRISYAVFC